MRYFKKLTKVLIALTIITSFQIGKTQGKDYIDGESIYVLTDRYVYDLGERMYFSCFVADDQTHVQQLPSMVKVLLVDGKGSTMDSLITRTAKGRFSYFFNLPRKGGVYYIKATTRWQLNQLDNKVFSKEIFVQEITKRHFYINSTFSQVSFSHEDTIRSSIKVTKRGDEPIDGLSYVATLMSNGEVLNQYRGTLDENGEDNVGFSFPSTTKDDLFLKVEASYQGNTEFLIKRVPMVKKNLELAVFYPTGVKQLVAGIFNTLVVKSYDAFGNDKDSRGEIMDDLGNTITSFKSSHNGMSEVTFKPVHGRTYFVSSPLAMKSVSLPEVKKEGVLWDMQYHKNTLHFTFFGKAVGTKKIKLVGKGTTWIDTSFSTNKTSFSVSKLQSGVYGISVYDKSGNVIGKRLWIKKPEKVDVNISFDRKVFGISESFMTTVNTNKEPASFSIRMIDEQTMKQVKDESHSISSWFYLGSELYTTIKDPTFYFDESEEKSKNALRLLEVVSQYSWKRDFSNGRIKAQQDVAYPRVAAQLSGYVSQYYDPINDLEKVSVKIKGTTFKTDLDKSGRFVFEGIPGELVSQPLILVAQQGIEKVEIQVPTTYNYFNNSFDFSLKPGQMGFEERSFPNKSQYVDVKTKELGAFEALKKVQGLSLADSRIMMVGARANYTTSSIESLSYKSLSVTAIPSYRWGFGIYSLPYDGYYLTNESYVSYNPPFQIRLDYNYNRSQPISIKGPLFVSTTTPFWCSEVESNEKGEHKLSIPSPNVSSGYTIICEGITRSGKCFTETKTIKVQDLIEVFTNVPKYLTKGDVAAIDLQFINHSDRIQKVTYRILQNSQGTDVLLELLPFERKSVTANLVTGNKLQRTYLKCVYSFDGKQRATPNYAITLLDKGHKRSVLVSDDENISKGFTANQVINGSAEIRLTVMNDFLDIIESTSARMIRQPNGCFEQVSSANYPNLLALKVLRQKKDFNTASVTNMIYNGYRKLVAYETSQNGFEWYGANPPHTTLTAYGLLQFKLMKDLGLDVDENMYQRNLRWLLNRRKNDGGYVFTRAKYGFSHSDQATNNAYVTWILSRITSDPLTKQIEALENDVEKQFDAYKMALLANVYTNRNRKAEARELLDQLIKHYQKSEFRKIKSNGSIMYSSGNSLIAEILALTLMAENGVDPTYNDHSSLLITKILSLQSSYGFGNTQSTALALEALGMYQSYFNETTKNRSFDVWLNDKKLITHSFEQSSEREYRLVLEANELRQGAGELKVICQDGNKSMFLCELTWLEELDKVEHKELVMDFTFDKTETRLSEEVMASILIQNKTNKLKPQTVAVIRIPAGLTYDINDLNYLKKEGVFNHFESLDDQLVLYFLNLEPNEQKNIQLALRPYVAGTYTPAESYVYQYYSPEIRSSIIAKPITILKDVKP